MRGCVPRVTAGHEPTTTAQLEIIAGKILKAPELPVVPSTTVQTLDAPLVPEVIPAK
jgi:hypothetical protein